MPIQNRKIKLTLIFLLIILSISAFSIIGIVVAFNTKQQSEPPKAVSSSVNISSSNPMTEEIYDTYTEFHITDQAGFESIRNFHLQHAETYVDYPYMQFVFTGKQLYLDTNVTIKGVVISGFSTIEYFFVFKAFDGTFYGQGHTLAILEDLPNQSTSFFCDRLLENAKVYDMKIKCDQKVVSSQGEHSFGGFVYRMEKGSEIKGCILEGFGVFTDAAMHGTNFTFGGIAYSCAGTITDCIVTGNIFIETGTYSHCVMGTIVAKLENGGNYKNCITNDLKFDTVKHTGSSITVKDNANYKSLGLFKQAIESGGDASWSDVGGKPGSMDDYEDRVESDWIDSCKTTWYMNEHFNDGVPYLRQFIPWLEIEVKKSNLEVGDDGYIDVTHGDVVFAKEITDVKFAIPKSRTCDCIDITYSTDLSYDMSWNFCGITFTAQVWNDEEDGVNDNKNKTYQFANWFYRNGSCVATFSKIPYEIEFDNLYDIFMQQNVNNTWPTNSWAEVSYGSKVVSSIEVSASGEQSIIYTYTTYRGTTLTSEYTIGKGYRILSTFYDGVNQVESSVNEITITPTIVDGEAETIVIQPLVELLTYEIKFEKCEGSNIEEDLVIRAERNGTIKINALGNELGCEIDCGVSDLKDYGLDKLTYTAKQIDNEGVLDDEWWTFLNAEYKPTEGGVWTSVSMPQELVLDQDLTIRTTMQEWHSVQFVNAENAILKNSCEEFRVKDGEILSLTYAGYIPGSTSELRISYAGEQKAVYEISRYHRPILNEIVISSNGLVQPEVEYYACKLLFSVTNASFVNIGINSTVIDMSSFEENIPHKVFEMDLEFESKLIFTEEVSQDKTKRRYIYKITDSLDNELAEIVLETVDKIYAVEKENNGLDGANVFTFNGPQGSSNPSNEMKSKNIIVEANFKQYGGSYGGANE